MDSLEKIEKKDLRDLFSKSWMTHDAMWFYHSLQEIGIEKTNKINKAAVRSMATIEGQRLKTILRYESSKIDNPSDFKIIFLEMFQIIKAEFMKASIEFLCENTFRITWYQCFAYDGIKKMGIIQQYQCGIFDRIEGWLSGLGLKFEVNPMIAGCMMHIEGKCYREYKVIFEKGVEN